MDLMAMITEIETQRSVLDELLAALRRATGIVGGKRRGRPPGWMKSVESAPVAAAPVAVNGRKISRKPFSAATRRKMALAQKKRWAQLKKLKTNSE